MTTHQSLVLGFFIAIGLVVVSVCGEHFEVASAQQLIKVLNISEANNFDANITLLDDLDFYHASLTLPLGASSNGTCVPFSGKLQGNGHSIHGVMMENQDSQGFNHAGLFCSLKGATVENLVIDSSCSFDGYNAGALCVSVSGSLVVRNVTNKAVVSGKERIGGFVGYVRDLRDVSVSFENCVSDGTVTGSGNCVGGFVGHIDRNINMEMTISNSTNNGDVTGQFGVGGFVGEIYTNITITISNFVNNGNVTGNWYAGGFVGSILYGTSMAMTISKSTNNGIVNGSKSVGGFIGYIYSSTKITITISKSTNSGNVNGSSYVGGFVGIVYSYDQSSSISLFITNSANKGSVSAKSEIACGVSYTHSERNFNVNTTILNSINKGSVSAGADAYGIKNNITKARNVVSMGDVTGSSDSDSYTFWESLIDVDLFFGLENKCKNCAKKAKLFEHNKNTGFYEVIGSGENVHVLLNDESTKQAFGMMWTTQLDITEQLLQIKVSGVFNQVFTLGHGAPLSDAGNLSLYFSDEQFGVVSGEKETKIEFNSEDVAMQNMSLVIVKKHCVKVGRPHNKKVYVVPSSTVRELFQKIQLEPSEFVVVYRGTQTALSTSDTLKDGDDLVLCYSVTFGGELDRTVFAETGSTLGEMSILAPFFNDNYCVLNWDEKSIVYDSTDIVSRNMSIFIGKLVNVAVGKPINKNGKLMAGETLEKVEQLFDFKVEDYIVVKSGTDVILNKKTIIENDTVLKLCHNVTVSGLHNESWIIEHGKPLHSLKGLVPFFDPSYVVFDAHDYKTVYHKERLVNCSLSAVIVDVETQDVVIVIDDKAGTVKIGDIIDAITKVIVSESETIVWVDVVIQDDDSYLVSVKQNGDSKVDVVQELMKCIS